MKVKREIKASRSLWEEGNSELEENQGSVWSQVGKCFQIKHARNRELGNEHGNVEMTDDLDKAVFRAFQIGSRRMGIGTSVREFKHL